MAKREGGKGIWPPQYLLMALDAAIENGFSTIECVDEGQAVSLDMTLRRFKRHSDSAPYLTPQHRLVSNTVEGNKVHLIYSKAPGHLVLPEIQKPSGGVLLNPLPSGDGDISLLPDVPMEQPSPGNVVPSTDDLMSQIRARAKERVERGESYGDLPEPKKGDQG